jgi:hypothetical protein
MWEYRLGGVLWAAALILGGALLLLLNLGILGADQPFWDYALAGFLALAGVGFFVAFLLARQQWWYLLPAWSLFSLGGMAFVSTLASMPETTTAALLFLGLAFAFAQIYLTNRRELWWAIIPGGFLFVLGVVIIFSNVLSVAMLGLLLFVGMGLVFCLLYLLGDRQQHWWALIPGAVLLTFGLFVWNRGGNNSPGILRWWPVLLMVIGFLVAWQQTQQTTREPIEINEAPKPRIRPSVAARPIEPAEAESMGVFGEYSKPAPGASVDIIADWEQEQSS